MPLRPKISSVELAFLLVWQHECSPNYALWHIGEIKCKSQCLNPLNFAPQAYTNLTGYSIATDVCMPVASEVYANVEGNLGYQVSTAFQ